jgi:hypothetical protein
MKYLIKLSLMAWLLTMSVNAFAQSCSTLGGCGNEPPSGPTLPCVNSQGHMCGNPRDMRDPITGGVIDDWWEQVCGGANPSTACYYGLNVTIFDYEGNYGVFGRRIPLPGESHMWRVGWGYADPCQAFMVCSNLPMEIQ